jgi:hypothetical protein
VTRSRFFRPEPSDGHSQLHAAFSEVLVRSGLEPQVAGPVVDLFLVANDEPADAVDPEALERLLAQLGVQLREFHDVEPADQVALLAAAQMLATDAFWFSVWNREPIALATRLIRHLAARSQDHSEALHAIFQARKAAPEEFRRGGIAGALLEAGLVDPCRFLDAAKIRTTTKGLPGYHWNEAERERDPSLPDFWVTIDPPRAMSSFATLMRREPAETLGAFASGLARCLELRYPGCAENLYPLLGPIAELLCRRRRIEHLELDLDVTRCCWEYGRWALESSPNLLPEDRGPLRATALAELGRMRGWLRGNNDEDAARFTHHDDYLHTALFFVLRTDPTSLWEVLRRLLLALRELRHLSVPLDLRTWDEGDLPRLPRPWGWVPDHISRTLEFFLGRELERDPALEKLRGNLARFYLDRLKTREQKRSDDDAMTNDALVEPDPLWRLGYLHAVRELHVNPGGRGHKLLAWCQHHDPDAHVREEAKVAHEALRRSHGLPDGVSPRRAIYAAFWWLRQTHVLALGYVPDQEGAQRTFSKEVRRARKLDEQG